MFYVFDDVLTKDQCQYFIDSAPKYVDMHWNNRAIDISDLPVVNFVKLFLKEKTNIDLQLSAAEIQLWPIGSISEKHIHDVGNRIDTKFNSLLYLNDDFAGGEFYTDDIIVKPKPGRLTLFDGSKTWHGINEVKDNHRYTLIFWWKK